MAESSNKSDKYIPSKAEQKLLEALANPENRDKSVTEVCKIADISRDTYYRCFNNKRFKEAYKEMSLEIVRQAVAPVVNSCIAEAIKGSFYHSKLILEMAGLYTNKQQLEHSGETGVRIINDIPRRSRG